MTLPRKVYSDERWREQDAWDQGYEAGLRRAQELAKKHVYAWGDEVDAEQGLCADIGVSFAAFDQAIDAEAAKERT